MTRVNKAGLWIEFDPLPAPAPAPDYLPSPIPIAIDIPGDEDWMKGAAGTVTKHITENHGPLDQWKHGRRKGGGKYNFSLDPITYPRKYTTSSGAFSLDHNSYGLNARGREIEAKLEAIIGRKSSWNGEINPFEDSMLEFIAHAVKQPRCQIEMRDFWNSSGELDKVIVHEMLHAFSMPKNYNHEPDHDAMFMHIKMLEEGLVDWIATKFVPKGGKVSNTYGKWVQGFEEYFTQVAGNDDEAKMEAALEMLRTPLPQRPAIILARFPDQEDDWKLKPELFELLGGARRWGEYLNMKEEMERDRQATIDYDERKRQERIDRWNEGEARRRARREKMAATTAMTKAAPPSRDELIARLYAPHESLDDVIDLMHLLIEYHAQNPGDDELFAMGEALVMEFLARGGTSADLEPIAKHLTPDHGPLDQWKHGRRKGILHLGYSAEGIDVGHSRGPDDPTDFDSLDPEFQTRLKERLVEAPNDPDEWGNNLLDHFEAAKTDRVEYWDRYGVRHEETAYDAGIKWYHTQHDELVTIQDEWPIPGLELSDYVGAAAAISPQNRWDSNLEAARFMARVFFKPDEWEVTDNDVRAILKSSKGRVRLQAGSRLEDLDDLQASFAVVAWAKRTEVTYVNYRDGSDNSILFGPTGSNVLAAVKILRGAGVNETLDGHKVRSFYNNLMYPDHEGSVTIDTHMVSAGYLVRMGGHSPVLKRIGTGSPESGPNNVKGPYPFYATELRKAARAAGMDSKQFQAIVWVWWQTYSDKRHYPEV